MGVKQRMEDATKIPLGTCASCAGKITITDADFAEAEGVPDSQKLDCLIALAKQGAQTKCQGCDVDGDGQYDAEKKKGSITCKGTDANGVVTDHGQGGNTM